MSKKTVVQGEIPPLKEGQKITSMKVTIEDECFGVEKQTAENVRACFASDEKIIFPSGIQLFENYSFQP